MFNDEVACALGLSLEQTYLLEFLHTQRNTTIFKTKIINNEEWFSFSLVDLFKSRKRIFEQVDNDRCDDKTYLKRLYNKNRAKFTRLFDKILEKILIKGETIRYQGGSSTYYKFNKVALTTLINGYPKTTSTELTENEELIVDNTSTNEISKSISTQLKKMDTEILKDAIEIAKENNISDYPYIRGIYNNLIENKKNLPTCQSRENNKKNKNNSNIIIHEKVKKYTKNYKKNKFHNFDATYCNLDDDVLDSLIEMQQNKKYSSKNNEESETHSVRQSSKELLLL